MAKNDKYQRGTSGYSKHDEKAAKEAGKRDYAANPRAPQKEREYRRDVGVPTNYLERTKTADGREINRKNADTDDRDMISQGRPPMSRKWIEK